MSGIAYGLTAAGKMVPLAVNDAGQLIVSGSVGGGGGTSDTTEATALLIKTAVQSIDAKTRALDASPPATKEAVIASDGAALNLASLAQSIARNADGSVSYVEVVSGGSAYRQTLTYTSGAVTGVSAWVKQ